MKKNIVFNSINIAFEKLFAMLLGFLIGAYVARYLGPEHFGLLSFSMSFTALFMPLNRLGLNSIIVREVSIHNKQPWDIINSAFTLKVVASLTTTCIIITIAYLAFDDYLVIALVSILAVGQFFRSFNIIEFYFQATLKSFYTTIAKNLSILISAVYRYWLILTGSGLVYFGMAPVLDSILAALLLTYFYFRKTNVLIKFNFDISLAKNLLKKSLPLILAAVATVIDLKIDQVIIKLYLPNSDLGNYAVAARVSELWYFIPSALMVSYLPDLSRRFKQGDDLTSVIKKLSALLFYTAFFVSIIIMFTSDIIINIIFGSEYVIASKILVVHIWASCFVFVGQVSSKVIIARGLQKYLLYIRLASSSVNILLNFIFIPKFGVMGAAYATLISYSIAHFFGYAIFSKTRELLATELKGIFFPNRKLFFS